MIVTTFNYSILLLRPASLLRTLGVKPPLLLPLLYWLKAISPLPLPWSDVCSNSANHLSLHLGIDPQFIFGVFYWTMHFHLLSQQTGPLFPSPKVLHSAIQFHLLPTQAGFFFPSFEVFNLTIFYLRFKTSPSLWFGFPFIAAILSLLHANDPSLPLSFWFGVPFIAEIPSLLHAVDPFLPLLLWFGVSSIATISSLLHAGEQFLPFLPLLLCEGIFQSFKILTPGTNFQFTTCTTEYSTMSCIGHKMLKFLTRIFTISVLGASRLEIEPGILHHKFPSRSLYNQTTSLLVTISATSLRNHFLG